MSTKTLVTISHDHPSLPGHFPGHPVIPGVVMLGEVMKVIRQAINEKIEFVSMPSVKFLSPLMPGETLTIGFDQQANDSLEFTCTTGCRLIASGCLQYRIVSDDSQGAL
jgi:3-hydroxymyristoyl/3-hydroxydecanoyl-(acyl carrier protein) dehydratase